MTDTTAPLPQPESEPVQEPDYGPGAGTRNMPDEVRARREQEAADGDSGVVPRDPA